MKMSLSDLVATTQSTPGVRRRLSRAGGGNRAGAAEMKEKARRRVNLFIDAEAVVDADASNDKESYDENDDLDGFIVADDIEF